MQSRRLLTHAVEHDGQTRPVLLYEPRHLRERGPLPLVLVFHGGASSPEAISRASAMHRVAEREGFLVAYPAGTPGASGLTWTPGGRAAAARGTDDVGFARKLIAEVQRRHAVDPTRVYAVGFSVGGSLVYELACLLADRIAAVAVVGGAMTTMGLRSARPVPLIHIHGTKDRRVPLNGGRGPATRRADEWPPVRDGIDRWRALNGCTAEPTVVRLGMEGVTGYRWSGAADVELWTVEGGRHAWPGSKRDADGAVGFSASEKIWSFFAGRRLTRLRFAPSFGMLSRARGGVIAREP